jgi:hypothetical protein
VTPTTRVPTRAKNPLETRAGSTRIAPVGATATPWSIAAALVGPLTNHLFDAMIPRFALHWDFQDLVDAIGNRRVLWTDPTNWMNRVVPLAAPHRYRYVGEGDTSLIKEFLR